MTRRPSRLHQTKKHDVAPDANAPKPSVEDLQMKKAIELLRENKALPLQKAA